MEQLTTEQLKEKIQSKENFILDLFATWCGPCKMMLKNLEVVEQDLNQDNPNNFQIYKFDVDSDMEFMRSMGIRSVPTVKIFKNGEETFSKPGVLSIPEVKQLIS